MARRLPSIPLTARMPDSANVAGKTRNRARATLSVSSFVGLDQRQPPGAFETVRPGRRKNAYPMPNARALRSLGGAGNVTGSRFLLESQGERILVDCGLFQEREFALRNGDCSRLPPESIIAAVLTHAHLDDCLHLPKLVRDGIHGRVFCTSGTRGIARVVLQDSGRIQDKPCGPQRDWVIQITPA